MKVLFANSILLLLVVVSVRATGRLEIEVDENGQRRLKKLGGSHEQYLRSSASKKASAVRAAAEAGQGVAASAAAAAEQEEEQDEEQRKLFANLFWEEEYAYNYNNFGRDYFLSPFFRTRAPDTDDDCMKLSYVATVKEILDYSEETELGTTFWFPVYDPYTLKTVGVFTEETTVTHYDECVTNGAFLFDYNEEKESYDSVIHTASMCGSTYNSVTGGAGLFQCASGYQEFSDHPDDDENLKFVQTDVYLCNTPCTLPDFDKHHGGW